LTLGGATRGYSHYLIITELHGDINCAGVLSRKAAKVHGATGF